MSSHTLPPAGGAHTRDARLLASILAEAAEPPVTEGALRSGLTRPGGHAPTRDASAVDPTATRVARGGSSSERAGER